MSALFDFPIYSMQCILLLILSLKRGGFRIFWNYECNVCIIWIRSEDKETVKFYEMELWTDNIEALLSAD